MSKLLDLSQSADAHRDELHSSQSVQAAAGAAESARLLWLASSQEPPVKSSAAETRTKPPTIDNSESERSKDDGRHPQDAPALDRYEDQIKSLEKLPRPENGSDIFVGSSTFARWRALEKEFRAFHAHDRAFGGSTIPEINHYFDRLFNGYTPKDVVFYAGTNDIGELHHSGRQVFEDFKKFEHKFHERFPDSNLVFVSISMAPSREERKADFDEANRLIKSFMNDKPNCRFVDVTGVMHEQGNDRVNEKLFLPDRLHMTERGYNLWEPLIRKALRKPGHATGNLRHY